MSSQGTKFYKPLKQYKIKWSKEEEYLKKAHPQSDEFIGYINKCFKFYEEL